MVLSIQTVRAFHVSLDVKQYRLSGWHTKQNQGRFVREGMEDKKRIKYTNINHSSVEGNFKDEYGKVMKPTTVERYKTHMANWVASSSLMNWHTFMWEKELFFHLLGLSILTSKILFSPSLLNWHLKICLERNLVEESGRLEQIHSLRQWRLTSGTTKIDGLHWGTTTNCC